MTDLETFTKMLDNQKGDSSRQYNRCDTYRVNNRSVSTVYLKDDGVMFVFDAQGRFLGIVNTRD